MAEKLKKLVAFVHQRVARPKNDSLQPAFIKGLIFGLAVFVLEIYSFPWLMSVAFVILAIILYFNPLYNARRLFFKFFFLVTFSFLITTKFAIQLSPESTIYTKIAFAVLFGVLFYLLIGIKQLLFIRRAQAYYLLYLSIVYLGLLLYFASEKISVLPGFFKLLLLTLFILAVIREFFRIHRYPKTRLLTATFFTLSLVNIEIIWAINLLPIEFTGAASLATLFVFLTTEAMRRYLQEELDAKFLRYSLITFTLLCAVVLVFSSWRP